MAPQLQAIFRNRMARSLLALVLVAGFGLWFYNKEQSIRKEAWTGVVVEKWEEKPVLGGFGISNRTKHRRRTHYYWRVNRSDGQTVEVKVPLTLYNQSSPGTNIEKIYSERYPRIKK